MALEPASGPLTEESQGATYGEVIRDYEPPPFTKWRGALPDYSRANQVYFQHRAKSHQQGSVEAMVTKLMKNWEVEIHNIADPEQWKTVDTTKFRAAVSGGCPFSAQQLSASGHYNTMLGDTPEYCSSFNTLASATTIFTEAFSKGFAWEVLEVLSGPPTLTFKWRHFGHFVGKYTDRNGTKHKGNGRLIDLVGLCIARVNAEMVIESLDVYFNPDDILKHLVTNVRPEEEEAPVGCDEADTKALRSGGGAFCGGKDAQRPGCGVM